MRINIYVIAALTGLCLLVGVGTASAQQTNAPPTRVTQPPPNQQTGQSAPATSEADLQVDRVVESQVAVNSTITIEVKYLDKWLQTQDHDYRKFVLYLDGNRLDGLEPALIDVKDKTGAIQKALRYDLLRKPENRASWTAVFGRRRPGEFSNRNVYVTVQQEGVRVLGQTQANLRVINWSWFWWFIILAPLFIIFCWFLCYKSDMIRVPGAQPQGLDPNGNPNRKAYSLARAQMAFWFFVVIISYVFIWMVTGYLSNLPVSVLTLIGISTATGLSSAVVDSSRITDQQNTLRTFQEKRKGLEAEVQQIQSEITALRATLAANPPTADMGKLQNDLVTNQGALPGKQTEIDQTDAEIARITATLQPLISNNFISDILSDDDGVSFHRLQIFGWTMVLILIFVVSVYDVLAMPDFDTTLLALMGISGGTYVGFKLPTQQG